MPREGFRRVRPDTPYPRSSPLRRVLNPANIASERSQLLLGADVRRVYQRMIECELLRVLGHVWPFYIFSSNEARSLDGFSVRTPHPMQFVPSTTTSRFHTIQPVRIYETFRVMSYGLDFQLEFYYL